MLDRSTPTPIVARGWAQFAGQPEWRPAEFTVTSSAARPVLGVRQEGADRVSPIDLAAVTALDELLGGPEGYHHLEIAVTRTPAVQAVWPPEFTEAVVVALQATLDDASDGAPTVAPHEPLHQAPEPVVDLRTHRSRAGTAVIAALAFLGCTAIVIGAVGLIDDEPQRPAETGVMTETTLRGPTTTGPTSTTTTSTVPPEGA